MKYDHLKSLKLQLKGKQLQKMANSNVSSKREYISLLECFMAYRLETQMFSFRENMPTMYGRDLTCHSCAPGPRTEDYLKICPAYGTLWQDWGR